MGRHGALPADPSLPRPSPSSRKPICKNLQVKNRDTPCELTPSPRALHITAHSILLLPAFPTPHLREHKPSTGRTTKLSKNNLEHGALQNTPGGKGPNTGLRNLQQSHNVTALGSNSEPDPPPTFVFEESRHEKKNTTK